jgi:hypothetical protein
VTDKMIITVRAKAWDRVERIRCMVERDGTVRVYDDVAGHYTLCHRLSKSAQARIRKLASSK